MRQLNERGIALIASLLIVVLAAALTAGAMAGAIANMKTTTAMVQDTRAYYAAEGAAEAALAELLGALDDGYLEDAELAAITPTQLLIDRGYTFTEWRVERDGPQIIETIQDGPFAGMKALSQPLIVQLRLEDVSGASQGTLLNARAQAIPIFQFGVFFDGDLEATNGPPMTFAGRVHANGNIYLSSDNAWYEDVITTSGDIIWNRKDFDDQEDGVFIDNAAGTPVALDFDSRSIPDPEAFKARSCLQFDCRLQTSAFEDMQSLLVPLPEGMNAYELIVDRELDDSEQEKKVKFAWLDTGLNPATTLVEEAFYDGREDVLIDALYLDASALAGGEIHYVKGTGIAVGDSSGDGVNLALVIENGSTLQGPITIATELPVYIKGNFNNAGKQAAAIAGDAITILSESFSESNPPNSTANETTVNAALMYGMVETPCDWQDPGCPADGTTAYYQDWYSGGLENGPRFLEDWSGVALHWSGSMVSIYASQKATGTWNGSYYSPPIRDWSFDEDLRDPAQLPPGTPLTGFVVRTAIRALD